MTGIAKKAAATDKDSLIEEISSIITKKTGVQLGGKQVAMVESRLKRRLYELGLSQFQEYREYFDQHRTDEVEALVSLLTTHHTFFFREFLQFEFLEQQLPRLVAAARARGVKTLEIYSAACSRGQEVYSLAMHLDRHLKIVAPDFNFQIFGSDVDPASVKIAENGVYRRDELKTAPMAYLGNHWAKGTGEISEFAKVKKSLRDHCSFGVVNLMDLAPLGSRKFDVIFCRNVFIYFTPEQVKTIAAGLSKHLFENGMLFVGVSESLHTLSQPLPAVGPSVYGNVPPPPKKTSSDGKPMAAAKPVLTLVPPAAALKPLRVLCVDDSASILTLLKKVLGKEMGFEVVGVAANGQEAIEQMSKLKPDVITLDIHMPVKTGIEFLEGTRGKDRPPVVMVTSVSRDDAALAWKALSLGASDYVEKPALNNLEERADEIRMKLKAAFRSKQKSIVPALDQQFAKKVSLRDPAMATFMAVFGLGDLDRALPLVKELGATGASVLLALEGADAILPAVAEKIAKETSLKAFVGVPPAAGTTLVSGLKQAVTEAAKRGPELSVMVLGEVSQHGARHILGLSGAQLLLEDLGQGAGASHLQDLASDILPMTSFAYLAVQFLAEKQKGKS